MRVHTFVKYLAMHEYWKRFSSKTPVFSTSKTDSRDIAEILLKVALNSINQSTVMGLSPLFKHSVSYSITNAKSMK
jgi:hypothetical protein